MSEDATILPLPRKADAERQARLVQRRFEALTELFEKRADLRGAYPPADFFVESVRWGA